MSDEVTALNMDDVVVPDKDLHLIVMCTNNEVFQFCNYYDVNIWTFVDLAFSEYPD